MVEKWLCNALCQSKERAILYMPLSNKTPPSLDSHRENSQTIITTLYTFSLIWSTVTLDRIFSCLIYHFALNEVFVMLCNTYASVFPSENFIMYVIYLGHIYLQSSILNSPRYICPPLILSQLHVLLVFCCFFVLFCFQTTYSNLLGLYIQDWEPNFGT